jgi:hypothetical protein
VAFVFLKSFLSYLNDCIIQYDCIHAEFLHPHFHWVLVPEQR